MIELKNKLLDLYEKNADSIKIERIKKEISKINDLGFVDFDINNLMSGGWGSNEDGDEELRNIFGKKVFNFPKPSKLISKLIASYRDKSNNKIKSYTD